MLILVYLIYYHNWRNVSTIYIYKTRLASNEIFSPSNKIHREEGQAKGLSAPLYFMSTTDVILMDYQTSYLTIFSLMNYTENWGYFCIYIDVQTVPFKRKWHVLILPHKVHFVSKIFHKQFVILKRFNDYVTDTEKITLLSTESFAIYNIYHKLVYYWWLWKNRCILFNDKQEVLSTVCRLIAASMWKYVWSTNILSSLYTPISYKCLSPK